MKKLITLLFTLLTVLLGLYVSAQDIVKGNPGMWPSFIKYDAVAPAFKRSAVSIVDADGQTAKLTNGKIQHYEKDAKGFEHYRYQQYYKGIAIENAFMAVHVKGGSINSQNGKWVKDMPGNLSSRSSISETNALAFALKNIGAKQYKWELPAEEAFLKQEQNDTRASFYPKATLVYYSGESDVMPAALRLAYKFDIYAQEPISRQLIFVDAENGNILGRRELIHETNAAGTAQTVYSGTQTITTDYTGANYRLRETGRGNGINTYNLQTSTNYAAASDFTDADNNWNNVNTARDEYATDAHWATEKTYDYYFLKFGRNSIDNAGMALNSYVHYSTGYFNAFWDGSRMTYGDGDATDGNKPLTSLDVCGHEITHGVTERTSALAYSYESGAMNEGFSDIFGTAIEAFARPTNTDWLIGGDFSTIRSMSNPNAYNQPDTYQGTFWYTGSGDNGGVHTNSGVLNYWFYLLTTGGSGVNDHGVNYNVTGIGMDKAAAIAYRLNTFYLVSTSDYQAARLLGIQAAEDLYGIGSNEAIQTNNAFTAVGLYAQSCGPVSGLTVSPLLDVSATLNWAASPGAVYYNVDYKLHTSTSWISAGPPTGTSVSISGLTANTLYDWRIRSSCNNTYVTGQFTTAPPICVAPAGLSVNPNNINATLYWNPALYAVSYDVEYKLATDNVWTAAGNTTTTSFNLTGLTVSTTYDWRIKTNCSFGGSSYAQAQFTTTAQSCDAPTNLTNTYNPGNVNLVAWDAVPGAHSYYLQFKWNYQSWPTHVIDTVLTTNSYTLTGIMSGLTLDWRVRTNCDSNYSNYSVSQLNTPCPAPASVSASAITSSSALISWTPPTPVFNSPFGYTLQYKLSTSTTWSSFNATSALSQSLGGLLAGRVYDVRVRLNCYSFNSAYAQTQFTTACSTVPSGLTFYNLSPGGATVKWNAIAGAVSYNLQYKKSTMTTWTTVTGIGTNAISLSGLAANTTYNYQVQMVCSVGTSAYSSPASFTTYCTSSGTNNQEWIDYFKFGTMERYSPTADAGGYFNAQSTYNPLNVTIGTSGIAGIISAAFSGATSRNEYYAVYIDFNRNGNFTDAGEKVAGQTAMTNAGDYNFTVNIPATATPGITAMRVVMLRQPTAVTPCLTGSRGETEDYYLNLVSPPAFTGITEPAYVMAEPAQQSAIMIAPNPTEGKFSIQASNGEEVATYEVMNSSGIVVQRNSANLAKQFSVDISALPKGLYFLKVTMGSGKKEIAKVVKQ